MAVEERCHDVKSFHLGGDPRECDARAVRTVVCQPCYREKQPKSCNDAVQHLSENEVRFCCHPSFSLVTVLTLVLWMVSLAYEIIL